MSCSSLYLVLKWFSHEWNNQENFLTEFKNISNYHPGFLHVFRGEVYTVRQSEMPLASRAELKKMFLVLNSDQ